jgi:tRNA-dihydrouridine synthase B
MTEVKPAAALIHPLRIGTVVLPNNLALAPMAGTTDLVFRRICRRFGAGLTVTELVSARGVCHDPKLQRNWRYLAIDPVELPVAIQLFGADPADFATAVTRILIHPILGQCSLIDINMGCPVAKVVKGGEGSALMRTPDLAARVVAASVNAAAPFGKPVTVKFRKGWDVDSVNAVSFARVVEAAGAAAVTVHGRTRDQMYSGRADWQVIGDVKAAVRIPVFGNGDIDSPEAARRMLAQTGVDGLMIGRAAQGNPWIFQQLLTLADPAGNETVPARLTPADKIPVIIEHLDGLIACHGEDVAVREMRKHLACYLRGSQWQGAQPLAALKNRAMTARTRDEIIALLGEWRI